MSPSTHYKASEDMTIDRDDKGEGFQTEEGRPVSSRVDRSANEHTDNGSLILNEEGNWIVNRNFLTPERKMILERFRKEREEEGGAG